MRNSQYYQTDFQKILKLTALDFQASAAALVKASLSECINIQSQYIYQKHFSNTLSKIHPENPVYSLYNSGYFQIL